MGQGERGDRACMVMSVFARNLSGFGASGVLPGICISWGHYTHTND